MPERFEPQRSYRVRHPAAPDLFVWWVETHPREETSVGVLGQVRIYFASMREPMSREQAEEMAALCGGTVEEAAV